MDARLAVVEARMDEGQEDDPSQRGERLTARAWCMQSRLGFGRGRRRVKS